MVLNLSPGYVQVIWETGVASFVRNSLDNVLFDLDFGPLYYLSCRIIGIFTVGSRTDCRNGDIVAYANDIYSCPFRSLYFKFEMDV